MSSNPKSASDEATNLKVRQLQQYLHRPGFVPASTHPFVKQVALDRPQSRRRFSMKRLIFGGASLAAAGLKAGWGAIIICAQIILSPIVWLLDHRQS